MDEVAGRHRPNALAENRPRGGSTPCHAFGFAKGLRGRIAKRIPSGLLRAGFVAATTTWQVGA
jgi:hypothetical protein